MRGLGPVIIGALIGATLAVTPGRGAAQQRGARPTRGGQTIVIRGQVPTPQVVTVRPRDVPTYSRRVLGADLGGHSFWSSIAPGYQLVPNRQVTGRTPLDSTPGAMIAGEPEPNGQGAGAGGAPMDSAAGARRAAEIGAMRDELARRRARLDSLQRAVEGIDAKEQTVRGLGAPTPGRRMSPADSAARAAEITELLKELEYRRARLDSLEAVVQTLGRPRTPADTSRVPRDSTARRPR